MDIPLSAPSIPEELKKAISSPSKQSDDEIFRELCTMNGLSYEKARVEGTSIETLEAFFSGFPRLVPKIEVCFPNLVCLCIVGQEEVTTIDHINRLIQLEELWIAECRIKKISGISSLKRLSKLYLYGNQIVHIQGLSSLSELRLLWLSNNRLTGIQGLEHSSNLRDLNLAGNKINAIGHSLDHCVDLEVLEISGNSLVSFKDVTALSRLPNLHSLGFNDPQYKANPICLLCNYTTQVLYHLPNLQRLDGHDIANKPYKLLAESTVLKKKMFYNMKLKVLERTSSCFIRKLNEFRDQTVLKGKRERLTKLWQEFKQLQLETNRLYKAVSAPANADELLSQMEIKMAAIKERILKWENSCTEALAVHDNCIAQCNQTLSALTDRLCLELESGGNIKFETGSPIDPWFNSCQDLMLSRFCAADYKDLGIEGIKIHRVTRVYNRMLRFRFDSKLLKHGPSDDSINKAKFLKSNIEYLFWMWDHELLGGKVQPIRILEEGFLDSESCQKLGKHAAVTFSNCLSLADRGRIKHSLDSRPHGKIGNPYPYRQGQAVIAKVFLGHFQRASDSKRVASTAMVQGGNNPAETCECSDKQSEWFVFDHEMAVPEYIVDFEYVTMLKPSDLYEQFDFTVLQSVPDPGTKLSLPSDEDVLQMQPVLITNPTDRLGSLSVESLKAYLSVEGLEHVTELNLHNQGLSKLTGISNMHCLKHLTASFNNLSRVDDLVNMKIVTLDISFNKLTTLDGMKNMTCLRTLDMSWNCMRYIRDEFAILRKHAPLLEHLMTQHNLWLKPLDFRLRVIARMKSLQTLDNTAISESEATAALRLAAGSRISQVHIVSHGRTELNKPRSLSLGSTAQINSHIASRSLHDRVSDSDSLWLTKVTSLCLDRQHLSKLSALDKLINLKWASFCHNDIVKMEGLDHCNQLEELYLNNNCIYKLEGLNRLTNLRRLSLSDNYLVHLDAGQLEQLTHLHYLALDHNKISSLSSIKRCKALIELYMSQNRITNSRDAFYLKNCQNLLILDFSDNPVTGSDNYRLFMIYHLSSLKAFDGLPVDNGEILQAREILGGRLTTDFVAEKVGHSAFSDIRELDLPQQALRSIDLGNGNAFENLRSINLEHNNLTSFGGLVQLPNLRVLCLNYNKIESITTKGEQASQSEYSSDRLIPVLESLEVLHLAYNGIKDLTALQVSRLRNLKALFLQGNELQVVGGLEGLHDLRELVLDRNKIKTLADNSFVSQWNLQELHIEENRIRDLPGMHHMESLQRLYLGMNRIQDLSELEKLSPLTQLVELSLVSCPVSRRLMHRPLLVYRMPSLTIIDGIPVSEEEQLKASLYYLQQEQQQQMLSDNSQLLPGINPVMPAVKGQVPVKVTNVSLGSFTERTPWSGTLQFDPSMLATADDRGKVKGNTQPNSQSKTSNQSFHMQSSYASQSQGSQSKGGYYGDSHQQGSRFNRSNRK
ncbi:leucine-rich repeat-containing protein 9-like [Watersipora subatra]|uniref:leucine-rich repeat-containing protein 9-like n=1 Tax=Watersipora subatra TaxID=2589382 RepID=UPI00355C2418